MVINVIKMAQEQFSGFKSDPNEESSVEKTKFLNQDTSKSEIVSKLYDVFCTEKYVMNSFQIENNINQENCGSLIGSGDGDVKNSFFSQTQVSNLLPESVSSMSDTVSPVTHIEIIKSSSRRVTGANRVVPLLTSSLKTGKLAVADFKLAEVYKAFLNDLENCDSNKKCLICQRIFLSCTELEHHVRSYHFTDVTTDQCFVCRRKYVFQDQLQIHLSQTHSISCPDLICKICFMEFGTTMEQKAHERKHDESHVCHMCPKKFSSEYLYQRHLNLHVFQVKPNDCERCDRRFKNSIALNIHKNRHVNVTCTVCKMHFPSDTILLLHLKEHDTVDINKFLKNIEQMDDEESRLEELFSVYTKLSPKTRVNTLRDSETDTENSILECVNTMVSAVSQSTDNVVRNKKGTECRLCGVKVSSEKDLLDHRKQFHLRNRTCPFCGKRSRSVSQTWRHMNSHLLKNKVNISKLSVENEKSFKAHSECSKDDTEASSSMKNKQARKNIRLFNCNICSRKFLYPGSRDAHVLQHCKDKCNSWKCSVCGQVFSHPGLLLTHSSAHEVSLNCQICDQSFLSQRKLQSHVKSHFGEGVKKVFKCNMCSVKCPTLAGLKAHHRCHTGERPFTCGLCQRRFKRHQAVKKHIEVVHNSANLQYYTCSHCPKMFNSSGNLIRHYLRVHCQVRRFICGVCGSRFSQNQDLRRHFKVHHEIDMPNINGSDRKALQEVYVIPDIGDLSETDPHALKIKAIVAEEKAKFSRLSELLMNKGINKQDTFAKTVVQLIQNFSKDDEQILDELQPFIEEDSVTDKHQRNSASGYIEKEILSRENISSKLDSFVSNSNNKNNGKLYDCENCHKSFPEENEYIEHIAEQSNSYVCNQCNSTFCNKMLLDDHFCSEHGLHCNVSVSETNNVENCLKPIHSIDNTQVIHSVSNISHNFCYDNHSAEQSRNFLAQNRQPDILTNLVTDTPSTTMVSKPVYPVSNNVERINTSMTLNINGIILQNVIIQQTPTLLQSVPLDFHNQRLVNSLSPIPSVVKFTSSSAPAIENHSSVLNMNNVQSVNETKCVNPVNSQTLSEKVEGNEKLSFISVNASQIKENYSVAGIENNETKTGKMDCAQEENAGDLVNHKNIVERPNTTDRDCKTDNYKGSKVLKCQFCEEMFCNVSSLNRHMKTHSENKPFGCPDCGKHFSEKHNLKVHLMTHTGERPYKCEDCGKSLRYRKEVLDHKRMHLGEKSFVCDVCGRKFIRQRELIRHKVIHTGERKHECPICGKTFARLDQLRHAHMKIHEDRKSQLKYSCKICNKSFRLKSTVKQHELLHSGLKPYKCELCKKSFALDIYLKAHLQCHQKRNNYLQCPKCPRRFISETTLQVHEKSFHARRNKILKLTERDSEESAKESTFLGNGNIELDGGLSEGDAEIRDVDFNILDSNNFNAVIYLQIAPEDVKLTLSGIDC